MTNIKNIKDSITTQPHNKAHILIISDNEQAANTTYQNISSENYYISKAYNVNTVEELIYYFSFNLIILVKSGDMIFDFMQIIKSIKSNHNKNIPIIMISPNKNHNDMINYLDQGVNDYLSLPIKSKELNIRIYNLLNINSFYQKNNKFYNFNDKLYNIASKRLYHNKTLINLSSTEIILLDLLIKFTGVVLSREQIVDLLDKKINNRSIDVQITRLRNKIESDPSNPHFIKTVRNTGYVMYLE